MSLLTKWGRDNILKKHSAAVGAHFVWDISCPMIFLAFVIP
jgi:hypothetical protein